MKYDAECDMKVEYMSEQKKGSRKKGFSNVTTQKQPSPEQMVDAGASNHSLFPILIIRHTTLENCRFYQKVDPRLNIFDPFNE